MRFEYIHFVLVGEKPKTKVWSCRNNKSDTELGVVKWYGPWRQYCFFAVPAAVFNLACLQDIIEFLSKQNTPRRAT